MARLTDRTKLTVAFCNFTHALGQKSLRKTLRNVGWIQLAQSKAECQAVTETVLYTFNHLLSHPLIYLFIYLFHGAAGSSGFIDLGSKGQVN
jgi:hypothetical protein